MTYRVVLVDDHPRLRELYRMALADNDELEVVGEAGDGKEAVEVAMASKPDLVVLDLSMPDRDGLQALAEIKAKLPDARVAVMSGFVRERIEGLVLEMGANAYLEKGVAMDQIPGLLLHVAQEAPRSPTTRLLPDEMEARLRALL